jgi:hypothetical protein
VIFAQDLQRQIDWRRSFMIELVDAFLSRYHAESFSIEPASETAHDVLV